MKLRHHFLINNKLEVQCVLYTKKYVFNKYLIFCLINFQSYKVINYTIKYIIYMLKRKIDFINRPQ